MFTHDHYLLCNINMAEIVEFIAVRGHIGTTYGGIHRYSHP